MAVASQSADECTVASSVSNTAWLVGTIKQKFSEAATPRLYKKYNYRVKWFDGWENHKLNLDDYLSGSSAPYKSWALLEKSVVTVVGQ